MPLDSGTRARAVTATLNYLLPTGEKPARYIDVPPPAGKPKWTGIEDKRSVTIEDGRAHSADFTLDRNGFALRLVPSAVDDFSDEQRVRDIYYAEAERLLRSELGAARVVVFDHTIRGPNASREPVLRVGGVGRFGGSVVRRVGSAAEATAVCVDVCVGVRPDCVLGFAYALRRSGALEPDSYGL